jgi:hypothetical protein
MKITIPLLLTFAAILFTSCDSTTPLDTGVNEDKLATALTAPADGDKILFTNTDDKDDPFLDELELSGETSTSPNISYVYRRVSDQRFDLDVNFRNNQSLTLAPALNNVLGEPTTLSSRFRELIFRDEVDFTPAELKEIIDLINPSGASLIINPDDPLQILATSNRRYRFEIRSNEGDKIRGSIGGVYFADESSLVVGFREPTGAELGQFRFLTIKHKIPFLTGVRNRLQVTERGTFVMDLVNRNGQPR